MQLEEDEIDSTMHDGIDKFLPMTGIFLQFSIFLPSILVPGFNL